MKKSFHSRFRNDLFPKMPQSYADGLQRALTRAGANPRKLRARTVLSWSAAAAVLAVCAVIIAFGVFARMQKRNRALAAPGTFSNGASLIDTWEVTQYDYNGVLLSVQMLGGSIRYTFNEDGTAVLSQTDREDETLRYSVEGDTVHLERTGQSPVEVDGPSYEGEVYDLRYDPEADTLTSVTAQSDSPVLSQSLAVVLMRVPHADPAVQKAVGTWAYAYGAEYAQRIIICADGTATLKQTAGTLGTFDVSLTYTASDGVLTFSGADIPFAARCNEDDTLTVAMNGSERIFTRVPFDLVGKWSMTGTVMYGKQVDAASLSGLFSIYLEFTDDGVMTLTGVSNSENIQERGRYTVNGYEITVTDEDGDPLAIRYDPGTDTLGMEHSYSETMGVTLIFSRTPDAVIPTPAPTATPVPTPTPEGEDLAKLKEQYPEYFGLDTESGLKVFVSEFACDTFSCVLVSGKDKDKTLMDVSFMHGTTVEQMKAILSTYDVAPETIEVIPYVNSLSSYWYKIDELYTSYVTFLIKGDTYLDAVQFDIDGDKLPEFCVLTYGPTSGLFTVTLSVYRDGKALCRNTFNLSYGKLRFEKTEAGLMLHHTYTEWNQSEPNEDVWLVTVDNGRIVWTNEKTGKPFTDYWGDETWNLNGMDPDTLDWSGARIGELYLCVGATAGDTVVPIPESCLDTQYGLEAAETDQDAAQDCVCVKQSYLTAVPYGRSGQVWGTYAHAYGEEPPSALRWKTEQTAENGEPIVLHFAQYGEPMAFGFLEDGIADAGPRLNEPTAESLFEADWDEDGVSECIAYLKLPETGKCLISDGERTLVLEDCISVRGFYGDLDKSSPHGNLILSVEAADGIEHVYELHPEGDAIVIGAEIDGYCFVDDGMLSEDEPYDLCIGEPTPFGARGYYTVHGDALTHYTDLRVALEIFDFGVDIQRDRDWLIKDGLLLKLKRDLPCTINGEEAVIEAGTYVYLVNYRAGYQEAKLKTEDGRAFKVTMNGDSDDLRIDGVPVSDYFDNAPQG